LVFYLVKPAKGEAELYSSMEEKLNSWFSLGQSVEMALFFKIFLGYHGKSVIQVATLIFLSKKKIEILKIDIFLL